MEAGAQGEHKLARGYRRDQDLFSALIVAPALAARSATTASRNASMSMLRSRSWRVCAVPQSAAPDQVVKRVGGDLEVHRAALIERTSSEWPAENQQHKASVAATTMSKRSARRSAIVRRVVSRLSNFAAFVHCCYSAGGN